MGTVSEIIGCFSCYPSLRKTLIFTTFATTNHYLFTVLLSFVCCLKMICSCFVSDFLPEALLINLYNGPFWTCYDTRHSFSLLAPAGISLPKWKDLINSNRYFPFSPSVHSSVLPNLTFHIHLFSHVFFCTSTCKYPKSD